MYERISAEKLISYIQDTKINSQTQYPLLELFISKVALHVNTH